MPTPIGEQPPPEWTSLVDGNLEEVVWNQLKSCYRSRNSSSISLILVSVYSLAIDPRDEGGCDGDSADDLDARLAAEWGPILASEARQKILTIDGVRDANVELVWDPPWTPDRISEEGKQKLGMV